MNNDIDTAHPNIFSLINTLKEHEVLNSMNYIRLIHGVLNKAYRRPEDVKRDEVLFNLKTLFFYQSISLGNYLSYTGRLFGYDKNVTYQYPEYEFPDIDSYLDLEHPIDLIFIQDKSFEYIKNYVHLNKNQFIDLVKSFRELNAYFYSNLPVDIDYNEIVNKYGYDFVPLRTSPDGNCLFNAVSLHLCGNENGGFKLKLGSIFILFEYEGFFRSFIISKGFNFTFETFITNTAKIGIWGNSLNIIALSFLTSRAINCFEPNNATSYNPYFNPFEYPIVLCLLNSHFVPALPLNDESIMSIPEKNPFNSIFFNREHLPTFISY